MSEFNKNQNQQTKIAGVDRKVLEELYKKREGRLSSYNLREFEMNSFQHIEKFEPHHLDDFLRHAIKCGASDVFLDSNKKAYMQVQGRKQFITHKVLNDVEMKSFIDRIYEGQTWNLTLNSGHGINRVYVTKDEKGNELRFRVNITYMQGSSGRGFDIVLRSIPNTPPNLDPELPQEVIECFYRKTGINWVVGATGSGKSTLLASLIKNLLLDNNISLRIVSFEAPIEFLYDKVPQFQSDIIQIQVPDMLGTFAIGIEEAMRKKPDHIFVGECRDAPTIRSSIAGFLSGHLVYTTIHANDVSEVFGRVGSWFSSEEKRGIYTDLLLNSQLMLSQRLAISKKTNKRFPIREYIVMDRKIVEELMADNDFENFGTKMKDVIWKYGVPFYVHARYKNLTGDLDDSIFRIQYMTQTSKSIEEIDDKIRELQAKKHPMFYKEDMDNESIFENK